MATALVSNTGYTDEARSCAHPARPVRVFDRWSGDVTVLDAANLAHDGRRTGWRDVQDSRDDAGHPGLRCARLEVEGELGVDHERFSARSSARRASSFAFFLKCSEATHVAQWGVPSGSTGIARPLGITTKKIRAEQAIALHVLATTPSGMSILTIFLLIGASP
jgi:hypothetical protein